AIAVVLVVNNEIGDVDVHVFLNVGIKLPVHLSQDIGRRWIPCSLGAQDAAANRHDKGGGNAFTRNVCDRDAEPFVIDMNVIEIIAAHLAGGHINAADLKSVNARRFGWKQNTLNVPCDFEIVVQPLLSVRHRVDYGGEKGKSRLLRE